MNTRDRKTLLSELAYLDRLLQLEIYNFDKPDEELYKRKVMAVVRHCQTLLEKKIDVYEFTKNLFGEKISS